MQVFADFARGQLIASTADTLTVTAGAKFPIATRGADADNASNTWFKVVLQHGLNIEICYVMHHAGDGILTHVQRGKDGTSTQAWPATETAVYVSPVASDHSSFALAISTLQSGKVDKLAGHSLISDAERVKVANAAQRSELGTAAAATLATSNQDQTVGRVLRVGDLGYGGDVPSYAEDIDDRTQRGWRYASLLTGTVGAFPPSQAYGLLHTFGAASDQIVQEFYALDGSNSPHVKFIRNTYNQSAWTAWRAILDTNSVIGRLSEGAWCQIDRTAAGDVYRYADGRMRIDTPRVTGYVGGGLPIEIVLPATFIGEASTTPHITPYGQRDLNITAHTIGDYAWFYSANSYSDNVWRLSIEGRWKA